MIEFFITIVNIVTQLLILLIIASVVLSYFVSPYHPVKEAIDRIVEPLLMPIRRVMPMIGMFDFSPLVLILLIEVLSRALISFLNTLRW